MTCRILGIKRPCRSRSWSLFVVGVSAVVGTPGCNWLSGRALMGVAVRAFISAGLNAAAAAPRRSLAVELGAPVHDTPGVVAIRCSALLAYGRAECINPVLCLPSLISREGPRMRNLLRAMRGFARLAANWDSGVDLSFFWKSRTFCL